MQIRLIHTLILCFTAILLSACGSSSSSPDASSGDTDVEGSIELSGADTAVLGVSPELDHLIYRENLLGSNHFLSATSSASALDFVRVGLGELDESEILVSDIISDGHSSAVFNITDIGVSITLIRNGESYLYSLACVSGCAGVEFDSESHSVTLEDVALAPTIGGDSDSQATASLTLNGTLTWSESAEDSEAPAASSSEESETPDDQPEVPNSGTAGDLEGNWNITTDEGEEGIDEVYWVIENDLSVTSYDYDGDSYDLGDNCYWVTNGRLTPTGNPEDNAYTLEWLTFGSDGSYSVNYSTTIWIEVTGNNLTFDVLGDTYVIPPSTIPESNYTPECDD